MCVIVPFTFPHGSTNSNLKVSRRRPIDRIIYHFVAFGQFLLFVGWHVWFFLFVCFGYPLAKKALGFLLLKTLFYPAVVTVLIYVWIIMATGGLGEIRWWPSGDRLSRLVPPSIKNATMTKCRWTLLFYLESSDEWFFSYPAASESSSSSGLIQSLSSPCPGYHRNLDHFMHGFALHCPRNNEPRNG
jgi:hypothetical protein